MAVLLPPGFRVRVSKGVRGDLPLPCSLPEHHTPRSSEKQTTLGMIQGDLVRHTDNAYNLDIIRQNIKTGLVLIAATTTN